MLLPGHVIIYLIMHAVLQLGNTFLPITDSANREESTYGLNVHWHPRYISFLMCSCIEYLNDDQLGAGIGHKLVYNNKLGLHYLTTNAHS